MLKHETENFLELCMTEILYIMMNAVQCISEYFTDINYIFIFHKIHWL